MSARGADYPDSYNAKVARFVGVVNEMIRSICAICSQYVLMLFGIKARFEQDGRRIEIAFFRPLGERNASCGRSR